MLEAEPTGQRCYRATGSGRNECVAYRFASIGARSCLPCIPPWSLRLGLGRECHLCRVAGNTVTLCDPMWHVSSRSGTVAYLYWAVGALYQGAVGPRDGD